MRKIYDYIIAGFIFLSAVFYMSGKTFGEAQKDMFHLLAPIIILLMFGLDPIRKVKNLWLNSFGIFALITIIFTSSPKMLAVEPMINILIAIGLYYVISNYMEKLDIIYNVIFYVMGINLIFVILQYFSIDPLCLNDLGTKNTYLVGLFGYPMNLGIYSSIALPVFAYKFKKFLFIPFICLLASKSFSSIAIGCVALLLYSIYSKDRRLMRFVIMLLMAGAVIVAMITLNNPSAAYNKLMIRLPLYLEMLKAGLSSGNIFGYGLGTFVNVANQLNNINHAALGTILDPWNEYLGWLIELGPISLFIVCGLFWNVLKTLKVIESKELLALYFSLAAIPLGIFFHSYTYFVNIGVICIALLAMFESKRRGIC